MTDIAEIPSVNPSTIRNRAAADRRKRGAVMVSVTLELEHLRQLVARGLLDRRADADREAIAAAVLASIAEPAPAALLPSRTVPKGSPSLMGTNGTLGVQPDYVPQQYPKMVGGVVVQDEREEAAVLARGSARPSRHRRPFLIGTSSGTRSPRLPSNPAKPTRPGSSRTRFS